MPGKTVRLESEDKRWIELTVGLNWARARVGEAEPFSFNAENLGYVLAGMGYQAWGSGSHFAFRRQGEGTLVEFQGPGDRNAATCRLSRGDLEQTLDALEALPRDGSRAFLR